MVAFQILPHSVLLVVDMQYDFMPGGTLPVTGGDEIIESINHCMRFFFSQEALIVLTQDWHTQDHSSFASSHPPKQPYDPIDGIPGIGPILWPDHCVQGSEGARLNEGVDVAYAHLILRKGYHRDIDSYSAFMENDKQTPTGLTGFLRENGIERVYLCGLALDYCVYYSALDALAAGFETFLFEDLTRAVDSPAGRAMQVKQELDENGCNLLQFLQ
ncbi:MAG TPA: bifunctional nicotinamidase/pyrazinamidase [Candidatus Lokiarchaeia archaeon]|nr:bifunctional nicotinamidase/pyrazinamidase [Candidatus Lokiarchaeia archaeon]